MIELKPVFYYPPRAADPNAAPGAPPSTVVDVKLRPNSRFGKVLEFNGTSSRLTLGPFLEKDVVTIAFWVRKFVSQGGASPGLNNPVCTVDRIGTQSRVEFQDSVNVAGGGSITANQDLIPLKAGWSHITVVFGFRGVLLYVNGELRQLHPLWLRADTWKTKQLRVFVGHYILPNSFFMGQIAQLEVFPLALGAGDILELAKPRPLAPLLHVPLGDWSYDETKKNSRVNDATGKPVAVIEGKPTLVPDQAFDQCLRVDSGQSGPLYLDDVLVPAYGTVAVWCKISRDTAPGSSPLLYATTPSKPQEQLWRVLAAESTQWVHYALVREHDEFDPLLVREKVYKDGQLLDDRGSFYENSPKEWGLREPAKGRLVLGQGLAVDLAHLMIFDVALSPAGLQQLIQDTRLLTTTTSITPLRQGALSLGGKNGNTGVIPATTGREIFGVTADILVRGRNPDDYTSRTTDLIVDGRSVGPIRLHRSSEKWLVYQKNLDLTPFAAGLPTIDVTAPGAGDGFEVEIRYDTLERSPKRPYTLTLRQHQEATLPARPGNMFLSGRADVYLRPLYTHSPQDVAWFIGGCQRRDQTAAKPGVWTLIEENVDLTTFVKYQRSLAVASRDVELRLKFDLEQLEVGQSKGVVEIHDARRSANILAPANNVFRAGTANLYIRGGLGGKAEYLNVYVGGSYVGRFAGQGTADWQLARENIALNLAVDGLQNVELIAYPAGNVVQADTSAAATWGLRLEYDFATSSGQATRTGAKVEVVEVYESGAKGWSFKGSGPCHLVFQVGRNRQICSGNFTARMNGGRELSSLRLITDRKVYVVGPGAQPVIPIFDGVNSVNVATFKIEPDNHRAPYEFGIDCQFNLQLGFDWYWNDELRRRIAVMRTNTDEIRARIRAVDSVLEYTVEKLDLSRKINDGLKDLDNSLATVHSLLGLAALIPPIQTAVQRMRDVVDGFHASVKRARETSDRVEEAIKPIREALAENEKRTTKVLQICAHVARMEAWSLIVVEGAKKCVALGEYTDARVAAARALESVCKAVVPFVDGFDGVQTAILDPCMRVENAVRSMREEIDCLVSLEAAIRRVRDELRPLLDTLKEIEKYLDTEIFAISVKKILAGVDWLMEQALKGLRPIFNMLNFNLSFDLPGLGDLQKLGLGLAADFKMFEVEWGKLAGFALKWETGFVDFEKQIDEVKKQYEKCCLCAPPAPGDEPNVILHEHVNYNGTPLSFGPGKYNLDAFNDKVSSVQVPAGLKLTLYEDRDWQGAARVFTSNAPYVGDDMNDHASSLIVEYI